MTTPKTWNNTSFPIPDNGDSRGTWGANLSTFLKALADNALSKYGGSFQLTGADIDFGSSYGLIATYVKSKSANIAQSGVIRLANNEGIGFRNAANGADKIFKLGSDDKWNFGSSALSEAELSYLSGVTSSIQTQINSKASSTDLTNHENDTSTHGVGTVAGLTETQIFTNKDYDGGTAANSRRITLPKDTYANLLLLTRKEGTIWYATDLDTVFYDDGSSLLPVGSNSGSGELNCIENPSAATAITGWLGSATRDTSNSPLIPVVDTGISIANTATTEAPTSGGYYTITTLPTGIRSRRLKVEFFYTTPATDVYCVSVYRLTTKLSLTADVSGVTTLPANSTGKFYAEFDATSSSDPYIVSITRTSGSTGACVITNVIVGPGLQVQGPAVGKEQDIALTFTNFTASSYSAKMVPIGPLMYLRVGITVSSVTGQMIVNLPVGYTIPSNANMYGSAKATDTGTGYHVGIPTRAGTSSIRFDSDDGALEFSPSIPMTWASGDTLDFTVLLPITEWSNFGNVSLLQQNTQSPIKAGTIMPFAGATVPTGWLECDGSSYSQTIYPDLYATLGSTWATCTNPLTGSAYSAPTAGNFRVPDLRGTFLRGVGTFSDGIGTDTSLAGYQADQMQGHYHAGGGASTTSNQVGSTVGYIQRDNSGVGNPSSLVAAPITDGTNGTPRTGKETRPRNVGVKYIIKAWNESFNLAGFAEATATQMGLVQGGRLPGAAGGAAIEQYKVGEKVTWTTPPAASTSVGTSYADWTNASISLTGGVWLVIANVQCNVNTAASTSAAAAALGKIVDGSGTLVQNQEKQLYIKTTAAIVGDCTGTLSFSCVVTPSTTTTYKIQLKRNESGGTGTVTAYNTSTAYSEFFAIRIA
ncbi:MAG TPA: phage tail protein [Allocoleopsis sp.]